jgi:ribosome-associated toxin RatA of RatAB toxin-antitoxin module
MREIVRSALVARLPATVYGLVADFPSYPQFVPGCSGAAIIEQGADTVVARLQVHKGPLSTHFTTRNTYTPGERIHMVLVEGPMSDLQGDWTFTPVGEQGCRIELRLQYAFTNALKAAIFEPLIESIVGSMVQAFVARAQQCRS